MPPFKISTVSYTEIKLTFINRPPDGVFTLTCFTMELEKHALTYFFLRKTSAATFTSYFPVRLFVNTVSSLK